MSPIRWCPHFYLRMSLSKGDIAMMLTITGGLRERV
jgi:hypothetical protein